MTEQKSETLTETPSTTPQTATEAAEASLEEKTKRFPNRGKKFRCLGNGEGDYVIVQVAHGHDTLPDFCMTSVPGPDNDQPFLQFGSTAEAMKWLKNDSIEQVHSGKVAIIKFCELLDLGVEQVVQRRTMTMKKKVLITGPTGESEEE